MRTQLILTTAALGLASLAASAQVYSVNIVGYININLLPGKLVMVANQLKSGDNLLKTVMPTAPDGTTVYTYAQGVGYSIAAYEIGDWTANLDVKPGVGMFIAAPSAGVTGPVTLVGEVPTGNLVTTLKAGLNLVASQVPQAGKLQTDLGYVPNDGDTVYQWDAANQAYVINSFEGAFGWSTEPTLAVGEGFFINVLKDTDWKRTFNVN